MIRKIAIFLYVLQTHTNTKNDTRGRGFFEAHRLNPWNPLSYITFVIGFIVGILMFGFVGIWKEINRINVFKWD